MNKKSPEINQPILAGRRDLRVWAVSESLKIESLIKNTYFSKNRNNFFK
jgi:hypothetical protein